MDFLRILWIFPEGYTGGHPKGLTCMSSGGEPWGRNIQLPPVRLCEHL